MVHSSTWRECFLQTFRTLDDGLTMRGVACSRAYLQVADGEDGVVHLLVPLSHGTLFSVLGMGAYISSCQYLPQLNHFTTPCRIRSDAQ